MTASMWVACDAHGIPRVYAEFYADCWQEALAYVRRRPDTGPLSSWLFEQNWK